VTNARDVVHQIEYRWDPVKDMSPVASSMSPELTKGWDPRIRPWVRHPNVDAPLESVCYQVLSAETVALAWRYRDRQAAAREDGGYGRPLVSRVLVGPASLLPPHLAMMLCRVGLPDVAGPRPGQVDVGAGLPLIGAAELTGLVAADRGAWLDQSAAEEKGLQQVVAAALSDPDTPLAIQLRDPYIFHSPRVGPQGLLLWGLWRTVWPLLGHSTARRGWSFSTFELPMGNQDASTLPDIVFRLAQAASGPPVNARQEIRVRPGDPSAAAAVSPYVAELAEWLVSEYRETNGDQLAQLIIECSAGQPEVRLQVVFDVLRAKWSPVAMSGPAASFVPLPPDQESAPRPAGTDQPANTDQPTAPGRWDWDVLPGQEVAERQDVSQRRETPDYWEVDQPQDARVYREAAQPTNAAGHWERPVHRDAADRLPLPDTSGDPDPRHPAAAAQVPPSPVEPWPAAITPPDVPSQPAELRPPSAPGHEQQEMPRPGDGQPYSVASLLRRLETEPDSGVFESILDNLLAATTKFEERVAVRRQMARSGWCIPAFERHGYKDCVPGLAGIFQVFVLPDLERPSVASVLGGWVRKGPPEVTAALLTASKAADEGRRSGGQTFQLMTTALGEAGLQKLLEVSDIPFDWPRERPDIKPGHHHSVRGFFAKIFGSQSLWGDCSSAGIRSAQRGEQVAVAGHPV
jgi:hypothetical protein